MTFPETVGEAKQECRWNVNKTPSDAANEAINQQSVIKNKCSIVSFYRNRVCWEMSAIT